MCSASSAPFCSSSDHVDELLLRELEPRDRPAELLAAQRVAQRRLVAVARRAERAPDDPGGDGTPSLCCA